MLSPPLARSGAGAVDECLAVPSSHEEGCRRRRRGGVDFLTPMSAPMAAMALTSRKSCTRFCSVKTMCVPWPMITRRFLGALTRCANSACAIAGGVSGVGPSPAPASAAGAWSGRSRTRSRTICHNRGRRYIASTKGRRARGRTHGVVAPCTNSTTLRGENRVRSAGRLLRTCSSIAGSSAAITKSSPASARSRSCRIAPASG